MKRLDIEHSCSAERPDQSKILVPIEALEVAPPLCYPNLMVRKSRAHPPDEASLVMHLRLWLETGEGLLFGMGRADILQGIERHGSLKKAAEELGISYRAAWGKIKRSEAVLGFRLVEQAGSQKEGYRLTAEGRDLKRKFDRWYREVEDDAMAKARTIFGNEIMRRYVREDK